MVIPKGEKILLFIFACSILLTLIATFIQNGVHHKKIISALYAPQTIEDNTEKEANGEEGNQSWNHTETKNAIKGL